MVMRIDDHKFFAGSGSPRFPKGVHVKEESDDGDMAHLSKYEDSAEAIKAQQMMNVKKQKSHDQKAGHRN